jgi:hypothetical protein
MTHLSLDDQLVLIEAAREPDHPHLAECARCRAAVAAARGVLADAGGVQVPEPSPLFWDHFSRRISEGIAAAPEPARGSWSQWRVLVPLAFCVAALVVSVVIDRSAATRRSTAPRLTSAGAVGGQAADAAEEGQFLVLSHLAGDFDLETLSDSLGKSGTSGAESAVWQLNEQERVELGVLLRAELRQRPSGS